MESTVSETTCSLRGQRLLSEGVIDKGRCGRGYPIGDNQLIRGIEHFGFVVETFLHDRFDNIVVFRFHGLGEFRIGQKRNP